MEDTLVPLGLFGSMFGMIVAIVYIISDRKVKLTLIQHGADAKTIKMGESTNATLRFGLLLVGIAVGILMGNIIAQNTGMEEEVAYLSMTFLFGGIGLLAYYFIMKSKVDRQIAENTGDQS